MGDVTRQPEAPATHPLASARLLVIATAGAGLTWALVVFSVGTMRAYNAWAVHQWTVRTMKVPGPDVTQPAVLGRGLLPLLSAFDFLVFMPLTALWLVLAIVVSVLGRQDRSSRLYLALVAVAVGAWILFAVAARAAASQPSDPFRPAVFTPAMDFPMLLALDGLITFLGSVWLWRRTSP